MNKQININVKQYSSIALIALGYITTIGFTMIGIGLFLFSFISWSLLDREGLAVITMILGTGILSLGTILFICKVSKDGDALLRDYPRKKTVH